MEEQHPVRFGNYEIIRPIDTGGMGEVYLARQRSAFGRLVALKIIRNDLMHDLTARERFLREARVSSRLKHEHILNMIEFGEEQGRLYLVTPYIEGGTLVRRLKSGPLSLSEVRQLFVPLVQAVAHIHRRGVIHRDLKPTNILLDEQDGEVYVRLIDFGIASEQGSEASPPLTKAGSEIGTIAYMAPERLNGIAAPSNDIFSLGIILHQMLTGSLPMGDQIDPMPRPFEYVVIRCIALRPEERFATADEVLSNFEHAYQLVTAPTQVGTSQRFSIPLDDPSLSHVPTNPLDVQSNQWPVSLQQSGMLSAAPIAREVPAASPSQSPVPPALLPFNREDYNAPTTSFNDARQAALSQSQSPASTPSPDVSRPPLPARRRRRSLLPLFSALLLVVLLAVAFLAYYVFQAVTLTAVTINFGPKVQVVSNTFTITAMPSATTVDTTNAIIPERGFLNKQSASQSGPTTGQVNCVLGVFGCQPGVNQSDVDKLANAMRPGLQTLITQALQQQVRNAGGTMVTNINFTDESITPNPGVGQQGSTVTVAMAEQGSVAYIVNEDARGVARQLLALQVQQLNQQQNLHYVLVSSTVVIDSPVIANVVAASGKVTIKVAAGGDVVYQFPTALFTTLKNDLKGKTLSDASAFLAKQPGIDAATIHVSFTMGSGNTLPSDIQRITIVPLTAGDYPPVNLPGTPTLTPTLAPTPTKTP